MTQRSGMKALLLMGVLVAAPASAGTQRAQNVLANVCVRAAENAGPPLYKADGIANQTDGQTLHIACPIPMSVGAKHTLASTSLVSASGSMCETNYQPTVTLIDSNSTQDAACTLYLLDAGDVVAGSWTVSTTGWSSSRVPLTFAMPRMDFTGRTLFMQCKVPPPDGGRLSSITNINVVSCDL
jgi:hypothetical protein